jgi:hypothetical protein
MFAIKTRTLGMIRYLRPDHNPLRRPVDRAHSRLVIACTATMMTAGPLVATTVAHAAPGLRRTIWVDQAGRTTSRPNSRTHTVVDAVATSATSVSALFLLVAMTYLLLERRLGRRRSASWEEGWIGIAPRWTGSSGRPD